MKLQTRKIYYCRLEPKLAWCAGVFDGEGYVGLKCGTKGSPKKYFSAVVAQKDPRLLKRFRRITKLGRITGPSKTGMHYLQLYASADILRLYEMLSPYLGPVKHQQFQLAFRNWFKQTRKIGRKRP